MNQGYRDAYGYEPRTKRLTKSKYERPEKTATDESQTDDKIKEKLANYEESDPACIPYNTHIRYKNTKFCMGGLLKRVEKDYVVLSNGSLTWSVQRNYKGKEGDDLKTTFYKWTKPEPESKEKDVDKNEK